ncbi:hypothetical protein ACVIGB_008613 [Bradyrhizobium sp. USDA 4341]
MIQFTDDPLNRQASFPPFQQSVRLCLSAMSQKGLRSAAGLTPKKKPIPSDGVQRMTLSRATQVFPRSEYLRRLAAVKAEMERREIDALVVTTSANITYLSGYTAKSGYVAQGLVVSIGDEEPTFITRRMDQPAALHQMFIDRSRVIGYPEALIAKSRERRI